MGKGIRKFMGLALGTSVAWAFAVKPRVWDKPDVSEIRRYDFARKGAFSPEKKIPENSLAAFQAAVDHGYGITMDVRLTKDGVPVVFHDEHTYRMTGYDKPVRNMTAEEITALHLNGTDETVPTLEQALKAVDCQVPVLIEVKPEGGNTEDLCSAICDVLDSYEGVFAVQAVDPHVLRWFKQERNEYIRGQIVDYNYSSGYSIANMVWDLFSNSLLMNFLTEPDMLICDASVKYNPSVWLCRVLYRIPSLKRTVRSMEEYEAVKTDGATALFEQIEP